MTDLTPNHPAVQVGCQAASEWAEDARADETGHITLALHMTAACITAALPHLAADDLRNTPAGRELMAEGWAQATLWVRYRDGRWPQDMEDANPYRQADA